METETETEMKVRAEVQKKRTEATVDWMDGGAVQVR